MKKKKPETTQLDFRSLLSGRVKKEPQSEPQQIKVEPQEEVQKSEPQSEPTRDDLEHVKQEIFQYFDKKIEEMMIKLKT